MSKKIGLLGALDILGLIDPSPVDDGSIRIPGKVIIRRAGEVKGHQSYHIVGMLVDVNNIMNYTGEHVHELYTGIVHIEPEDKWKADFPNNQDPIRGFIGNTVGGLLMHGGLNPTLYNRKWDFESASWVPNKDREK